MPTAVEGKDELTRAMRSLGVDVYELLASVPDQILIVDRRQRAVAVAGAWPYDSPPRPHDLIGNRLSQVFGASSAALHENAAARALRGETATYEWSVAGSRHEVRLSTTVGPLRNPAERIVAAVFATRNVSRLRAEEPYHQLSAREQEVLQLLREGYRPRSIAEILHVSPQTVRNQLKAIFKKTGTHSQEELITMTRRA